MEQYKYSEAAKAFETVVRLAPEWVAARFNLGLAYFNMHGQQRARENLKKARKIFEAVLASEPDLLPAQIVKPDSGRLLWLVDVGAGALL